MKYFHRLVLARTLVDNNDIMGEGTRFITPPLWDRVGSEKSRCRWYIDENGERRYDPTLTDTVSSGLFGYRLAEYLNDATERYYKGGNPDARVLSRREGLQIERLRPGAEERDVIAVEDYIRELCGPESSVLRTTIMTEPYDPSDEVVDATIEEVVRCFNAAYNEKIKERYAAILDKIFGEVNAGAVDS